jgi:hypothetical protein
VVVGRTVKVKLWDKNRSLDMAFKHQGLYERDNTQKAENLVVKVTFVKAPPPLCPRCGYQHG